MREKLPSGKRLKDNILLAVGNLPPMPGIMKKAMEVMEDPDSNFQDIADLIEKDQSLSLKVLKMSNSAYYHRVREVTSVQDAALVLGLNALAEIITVASSARLLGDSMSGYEFPSNMLWQHSIAVGFGSKLLAEHKCPDMSKEAFTAGLIHDVGKIILDPYIAERKEGFDELMSDNAIVLTEAEKKMLGFDHAEIAAEICKKWNIPKSIYTGVRYHHHPSSILGSKLSYIVYIANQMVNMSGMDVDGITLEIGDTAMKVLDIEYDEIESIMDEVIDLVKNVISTL